MTTFETEITTWERTLMRHYETEENFEAARELARMIAEDLPPIIDESVRFTIAAGLVNDLSTDADYRRCLADLR